MSSSSTLPATHTHTHISCELLPAVVGRQCLSTGIRQHVSEGSPYKTECQYVRGASLLVVRIDSPHLFCMKHGCRFWDLAPGRHEIEICPAAIKRSRIPLVAQIVVGIPKLTQLYVVAVVDDRRVFHDDLRVQNRAETRPVACHTISSRISSLESFKALCNLPVSTSPTSRT